MLENAFNPAHTCMHCTIPTNVSLIQCYPSPQGLFKHSLSSAENASNVLKASRSGDRRQRMIKAAAASILTSCKHHLAAVSLMKGWRRASLGLSRLSGSKCRSRSSRSERCASLRFLPSEPASSPAKSRFTVGLEISRRTCTGESERSSAQRMEASSPAAQGAGLLQTCLEAACTGQSRLRGEGSEAQNTTLAPPTKWPQKKVFPCKG